MSTQTRRRLVAWLGGIAAVACFTAGGLQAYITDLRQPPMRRGSSADLIYLPSVDQAKLLSLGFRSVYSDYYWVRALQYFTDPTQEYNQYKNLADLLEIVVGIDPEFEYAYKFAGIAIPFDAGRLHWKHTKKAISFLERGAKKFPDNWQMHFYLGYCYLNFANRPEEAAEEFAAAARLPGSPAYLGGFAARVFSVAGAVDRAIAFAAELVQTSDDPQIVAAMQSRLRDLFAEKELQRLESAAKSYKERHGEFPHDLSALLADGGIAPPPPGFDLDSSGIAHAPGQVERMKLYRHQSDE